MLFKEHVLNKGDFATDVRLMTSTAALVQELSTNLGGIGYGGEAYRHGKVKSLYIRKDAASPAAGRPRARRDHIPISRPLFLYTTGSTAGLTQQFIDFCNSPKGQTIVREVGYVPLKG